MPREIRLSWLGAAALGLVLACRLPRAEHAQALQGALRSGDFASALQLVEELEQAGDARVTSARITLAERLHDATLLPRTPPEDMPPDEAGALALAVYSIQGLAAAARQLHAACQSPASEAIRSRSCALAEQARLARGRSLLEARGANRASVELLPGAPLPIITAAINGSSREQLIIDTGAAHSVLSRRFCERAQIPFEVSTPYAAFDSAGHAMVLYPALVDHIEIGDIAIYNVPVFVTDLPVELPVAGWLAPLDTLRDQSVELDQRGGRLRLLAGQQAELKDWTSSWGVSVQSTPLIWVGTQVFVEAEVDGLAGYFLFDSGTSQNLIDREAARQLGRDTELSALLAVGEAPPERTRFSVRDAWPPAPEQLIPLERLGSVGNRWLEHRRVWLPPGGRSLVFAASSQSE